MKHLFGKGNIPWNEGLTKKTDERVKYQYDDRFLWNKGLTKKEDARLVRSEACRQKMSEQRQGRIPWNKGLTTETSEILRKKGEARRGIKRSRKTREKLSRVPHLKGKDHPNFGKTGEKASRWIDGRSFLPYVIKFTRQLKELIRHRDGYQCQKCGCPERENMQHLSVHHIDYDKANCLPSNLTSLCKRCNTVVNSDREFWEQYFGELLAQRVPEGVTNA